MGHPARLPGRLVPVLFFDSPWIQIEIHRWVRVIVETATLTTWLGRGKI